MWTYVRARARVCVFKNLKQDILVLKPAEWYVGAKIYFNDPKWRLPYLFNASSYSNKINILWWNKENGFWVRQWELKILKLSHGGSSQRERERERERERKREKEREREMIVLFKISSIAYSSNTGISFLQISICGNLCRSL